MFRFYESAIIIIREGKENPKEPTKADGLSLKQPAKKPYLLGAREQAWAD